MSNFGSSRDVATRKYNSNLPSKSNGYSDAGTLVNLVVETPMYTLSIFLRHLCPELQVGKAWRSVQAAGPPARPYLPFVSYVTGGLRGMLHE